MMRPLPARLSVAALALLLGAQAFGQSASGAKSGASASPIDTLFMSTTVGSFKILPAGPDKTRGTLDVEFEGTVMVSGLTGTATPGPGVRLEYKRDDHNRRVFFGKGRIRVDGEFRAIQFFGRNLKGSFRGSGVARLYGEFDKKMETGYYWFASRPEKIDWGSYGRTVVVPPQAVPGAPGTVKGTVRDVPPRKIG